MSLVKLCHIDELDNIDSRGFVLSNFDAENDIFSEHNIFVVRNQNEVFAYQNSCPHNFAPLNWSPDEFLNYDKDYIQCANHGALFEIKDGNCIYGPCSGQSLEPVEIKIEDNIIFAAL